jgi:hypothetical protein
VRFFLFAACIGIVANGCSSSGLPISGNVGQPGPGISDSADLLPPDSDATSSTGADMRSSGVPTATCTTDILPGAIASGTVSATNSIDLAPLCDGWVAMEDRSTNQLLIRNLITGSAQPPIQLTAAPGRLVSDGEHNLVYASLAPATGIAKVDLSTGLAHQIAGPAADMIALGNNGQVFGIESSQSKPRLHVFDGAAEKLLASLNLPTLFDGSLVVFDRFRNLVIIAARGGDSLDRFWFDSKSLTVGVQQSLTYAGNNGQDLAISPDGLHLAFSAGGGNGSGYSIKDYHTDNFNVVDGVWATGPYPTSAAFSPDGKYLVATDGERLLLFAAATHALVKSVPQDTTVSNCPYGTGARKRVAFSRGSKLAFMLTGACDFEGTSNGLITYTTVP